MATTIDELRAFGSKDVTLTCNGTEYHGRIVADRIGDRAVNFLFAPSEAPESQIVITLDDVSAIAER